MFGHKQLCLIIVFLFSFPVLMEVPAIQVGYNLSSSRRPTGRCIAVCSRDIQAFILIQTWSWHKCIVIGKLTLKSQISMDSAKRLYCLWQVFYMHSAFKRNIICYQQWKSHFTMLLAYAFLWLCIFLVKETIKLYICYGFSISISAARY